MSGKGNSAKNSGGSNTNSNASSSESEPTIVSGYQYHTYARGSGGDRYHAYLGTKNECGEPEFLDWGPKGEERT